VGLGRDKPYRIRNHRRKERTSFTGREKGMPRERLYIAPPEKRSFGSLKLKDNCRSKRGIRSDSTSEGVNRRSKFSAITTKGISAFSHSVLRFKNTASSNKEGRGRLLGEVGIAHGRARDAQRRGKPETENSLPRGHSLYRD